MKTKDKLLNKVFGLLLAVFVTFSVITAGSVANAQSATPTPAGTSFLCTAFPCNGILGSNGQIDVPSIVALVFRIILYAAILWTIWNVTMAGIKIAGAKEDADKRKEGIQAVINAVIGLVVALLAFGIVSTVLGTLNAGNNLNLSLPCTGFKKQGNPPVNVAIAGFKGTGDDANNCYEQGANGQRGDKLEPTPIP